MTARIRLRRADISNWDSDNPTLDHGEIGLAYDDVDDDATLIGFKVGNGDDTWSSLPMYRPPSVGSRSGLGDGDDTEGGGNAPVTWDDVALLALTNTFAGAQTMQGGLVVDESATDAGDAAVTIQNGNDAGGITIDDTDATITNTDVNIGTTAAATDGGNVVVADDADQAATPTGGCVEVAREVRLPSYDDTNDRDGLVSDTVSDNPGGVFLDASGPFLANGAARGQAKNASTNRGPYVQAKDDIVEVGGKDASDVAVPLRYASQPAADFSDLNDLDIPSAELVGTFGQWFTNMTDGSCTQTTYDADEREGTESFTYDDSTDGHSGEHPVGSLVLIKGESCNSDGGHEITALTCEFECTGAWVGIGQACAWNGGGDNLMSAMLPRVFLKMSTDASVDCVVSSGQRDDPDFTGCSLSPASWNNQYKYWFLRIA
jgi:hypothetical protein